MSEADMRIEVRIWALESVVTQLAAVALIASSDPAAIFNDIYRKHMRGARAATTFKGVGPAQSDMYSAEFESALTRLAEMVAFHLRHHGIQVDTGSG